MRSFMLWSLLAPLVLWAAVAPVAAQSPEATREPVRTGDWRWTEADLDRIARLEARTQKDREFWHLQTAHWIVRTDISKRFCAEAARYMDLFAERFPKIFPVPAGSLIRDRPTLMVFSDVDAYRARARATTRGLFRMFYDGRRYSEFHLYTYAANPKQLEFRHFYRPILLHEGTHALLQRRVGAVSMPTWFNEAHASYFEFWDLAADAEKNENGGRFERSYRMRALTRHFKDHPQDPADLVLSLPALGRLTTFGHFLEQRANLHYASCELFMQFMLADPERLPLYVRMIKKARANQSELLSAEEMERLAPAWQGFVRERFGRPVVAP